MESFTCFLYRPPTDAYYLLIQRKTFKNLHLFLSMSLSMPLYPHVGTLKGLMAGVNVNYLSTDILCLVGSSIHKPQSFLSTTKQYPNPSAIVSGNIHGQIYIKLCFLNFLVIKFRCIINCQNLNLFEIAVLRRCDIFIFLLLLCLHFPSDVLALLR